VATVCLVPDRTSFAKLSSVQEVLAWSYYMSVFMHVCNDLMHIRLQMETRVVVSAFVCGDALFYLHNTFIWQHCGRYYEAVPRNWLLY
jgi:hypothetical protein